MQSKLKLCDGCNKPKKIWKFDSGTRNRYCQQCWTSLKLELPNNTSKPTVQRQPIARVSEKRSKEERIYAGRRIIFLTKNPTCKANIPGICTKKSCEVHHKKGRIGKLYLDKRFWLPTCSECHKWIELHPIEAKLLGLSLSRLEIESEEKPNGETTEQEQRET